MQRREINTIYAKIIDEAQRIVFDAIAESCRKNRTECVTNGPFGTMFTRTSDERKPGWSQYGGRWHQELDTPKGVQALIDWYEEKFGPIPQAINKQGKWV